VLDIHGAMADVTDDNADSIPLETFYDASADFTVECSSSSADGRPDVSNEGGQGAEAALPVHPPDATQAQNIGISTRWLAWLRKKVRLLSALEKGLLLALSVLMVWLAWVTLMQGKKQGSLDKWSSLATFREDCRRDKETTGSMSAACNKTLSVPLTPPSLRSLGLGLYKTTRSKIPGAAATGSCGENALAREVYVFVTTVLALALTIFTRYFLPRLRTQIATTTTWVPITVPRPCAPSISHGPKLTTAGIDYLIDVLVSDLVDINVASESVALPLAHFARDLKKMARTNSRADGQSEYERIHQSFSRSLRTMESGFVPVQLLVKLRARDSEDELGQSSSELKVSTKDDSIEKCPEAATIPTRYVQLIPSLPLTTRVGTPSSSCRSSGEDDYWPQLPPEYYMEAGSQFVGDKTQFYPYKDERRMLESLSPVDYVASRPAMQKFLHSFLLDPLPHDMEFITADQMKTSKAGIVTNRTMNDPESPWTAFSRGQRHTNMAAAPSSPVSQLGMVPTNAPACTSSLSTVNAQRSRSTRSARSGPGEPEHFVGKHDGDRRSRYDRSTTQPSHVRAQSI